VSCQTKRFNRNKNIAKQRKISNQTATFMTYTNSTETHRLKLLVVGKSQNPRALKNRVLPLIGKNIKRALVTRELFYG
jgi:hypothetical protein